MAVPIEETSVPWTLDRRNPDRYSAVLTASVPPCGVHDPVADAIPGTSLVRVLAYGTVAARCGPPRPVTVDLQAASVTHNLPPVLALLGSACTSRAPAAPHRARIPGRRPGPSSRSASSIAARRSPCTSVTCWPRLSPLFLGEDPSTAQPARSSDPAVLGPLGSAEQGPFAEFRAWQPGQAILTTAAGTWLVHVVVPADAYPGN